MNRMANVKLVVFSPSERGREGRKKNGEKRRFANFIGVCIKADVKAVAFAIYLSLIIIIIVIVMLGVSAFVLCVCVQNVRYLTSILGQQPLARTTIANQFHILYVSSRQPILYHTLFNRGGKTRIVACGALPTDFHSLCLIFFFCLALPASLQNWRPCSVPYLVCIVRVYTRQ